MEFKTRQVGHYMQLDIEINDVKIDLGLQDQMEIKGLIEELKEAIEDFERYLND